MGGRERSEKEKSVCRYVVTGTEDRSWLSLGRRTGEELSLDSSLDYTGSQPHRDHMRIRIYPIHRPRLGLALSDPEPVLSCLSAFYV